ncbi:MAG: NIPSNAP family containing protein, partial [Chitinophagaceae bacterium]
MLQRILGCLLLTTLSICCMGQSKSREFYELRIYSYTDSSQERVLDGYLEKALIPALARRKVIHVGAFKAISNDTGKVKTLYVLIPYSSFAQSADITRALAKDAAYQSAGSGYLDAGFATPPYTRMQSIFLEAFPMAPVALVSRLKSPLADRVYELR